jgi:hypothetical protein
VDTWKAVVKLQKSSYLAWIGYTDLLTKLEKYDEVRAVFSDICQKKIDWPETIWDSWVFFENLYGDVENLEECLAKVEKAQVFVNARRAKVGSRAFFRRKTLPEFSRKQNKPVMLIIRPPLAYPFKMFNPQSTPPSQMRVLWTSTRRPLARVPVASSVRLGKTQSLLLRN